MARLKLMGFLTLEQLADMSDADCNNVGFGAKDWRRRAAEHLIVIRDAAMAKAVASQPAVDHSAVIADLMRKLDEQNAKIAALVAEKEAEKPAEIGEAPKRRPRKPAGEAQPEAAI
jgi:hypothetical protein